MHRLGLDTDDLDGVQKLFQMKHLHIQGIFTHLCCADSRKPEDISFTRKQIRSFYGLISQMETAGLLFPKSIFKAAMAFSITRIFPAIMCGRAFLYMEFSALRMIGRSCSQSSARSLP